LPQARVLRQMCEPHEQALFPSRRREIGRRTELRPSLFLSRERILVRFEMVFSLC